MGGEGSAHQWHWQCFHCDDGGSGKVEKLSCHYECTTINIINNMQPYCVYLHVHNTKIAIHEVARTAGRPMFYHACICYHNNYRATKYSAHSMELMYIMNGACNCISYPALYFYCRASMLKVTKIILKQSSMAETLSFWLWSTSFSLYAWHCWLLVWLWALPVPVQLIITTVTITVSARYYIILW